MLKICAWCKKVEVDGQFTEVDLDILDKEISHGCCPDCFKKEMNKFYER